MKCKVNFKELSLYLDGKYQKLDKHIIECTACKEKLEKLKIMKESLSNLAPIKESEGFDIEFNRLLEDRLSKRVSILQKLIKLLREILTRSRDTFLYPMPVAVRITASFILVIAVTIGARAQIMYKIPFVEFVAGDVKIYDERQKTWVALEIDKRLNSGDKIHSKKGGLFNIVSRGKYKARVKDNSMIVIARQKSGWRDMNTDFNITYGNLLVNTTKNFKGSKMRISTPSCDSEVVGTAFIVRVLGLETWLGVLEGEVKVMSKAHPLKSDAVKNTEAFVSSGQKISIRPYQSPTTPELCSEKEWLSMQELYQLVEGQKIMLIISTGSNRIEELLGPTPVYIYGLDKVEIPKGIPKAISAMIDAMKGKDRKIIAEKAKEMERLLIEHPDPRYGSEILTFIASTYYNIRDYENALRIFNKVIADYHDSSLASLAQCAIATIYLKDIKDLNKAKSNYTLLLQSYPNSVDAIRAKEVLASLK